VSTTPLVLIAEIIETTDLDAHGHTGIMIVPLPIGCRDTWRDGITTTFADAWVEEYLAEEYGPGEDVDTERRGHLRIYHHPAARIEVAVGRLFPAPELTPDFSR
jgi:hypothetical protein